jgi:hypothetical protein
MTQRRIDDDDDSYDEDSSCCQQNMIKLIVVICMVIIAIGCGVTLAIVIIKQTQRERALQAKKNTWTTRLEECAPILKVAGPIIKIIIKVAFSMILI